MAPPPPLLLLLLPFPPPTWALTAFTLAALRGGSPPPFPSPLLTIVTAVTVVAVTAAACPAVCRCAGGRVYCNDRGLTAVPEGLPPGATTLFLQNNRIGDAGIPARLGRLSALKVLYLYANALEQLPAHLPPPLRELHLQENNVRGLCRRALARAPLLERLHLDDNSVSAAGIEEDAFAENRRLRLLFLSRNHLSSVPPGLPPALEELRLDDNRIHTIPLRAFEGLPALRRLVLDGNLLANQRMADDTFSRLANLSELSLGRNALAAPPANLPRARLRRLSLAANAISHVPAGALARMRALERLDLSDNNLTTLPRGLFDDLGSLSHLGLRNNPWFCGCNLAWLRDWLRRRAPRGLEVKGLLCQAPARLRGLPVGELRGEMDACEPPAAPAAARPARGMPPWRRPQSWRPLRAPPRRGGLWVQAVPGGALRVRWPPAPPGESLRLSWLRPGAGGGGGGGDRDAGCFFGAAAFRGGEAAGSGQERSRGGDPGVGPGPETGTEGRGGTPASGPPAPREVCACQSAPPPSPRANGRGGKFQKGKQVSANGRPGPAVAANRRAGAGPTAGFRRRGGDRGRRAVFSPSANAEARQQPTANGDARGGGGRSRRPMGRGWAGREASSSFQKAAR
ncbi:LOW QUALITY PROTEIN: leucine-rich repeat transmembrane protein FLRT1-like [Opisthocomus hoazin]|uniref:LOW QUALITY PROTEIN: leucine-rich repeat transmembrane protein FLRT1-like n=1 Tax=Opisthocomus hoazin TaxID=30419 RepID=UPI003F52A1A6